MTSKIVISNDDDFGVLSSFCTPLSVLLLFTSPLWLSSSFSFVLISCPTCPPFILLLNSKFTLCHCGPLLCLAVLLTFCPLSLWSSSFPALLLLPSSPSLSPSFTSSHLFALPLPLFLLTLLFPFLFFSFISLLVKFLTCSHTGSVSLPFDFDIYFCFWLL